VRGPMQGGTARLPGDVSSQFVSGLLLAGPCLAGGLRVEPTTPLVSTPYVAMTAAVMAAFGAGARRDGDAWIVPQGRYRAATYAVEPDASAASYFFAAAVLTGGRVTVPGLGRGSLQGDLAFVDVLERMGAVVEREDDRTTVAAGPGLHGVDVDLSELSDTAQTLAAVAVFADSPTRVRGIAFARAKETDRLAAVVRELRRVGVAAEETDDGFLVHPGTPQPAVVETYDDHRMAMSFALLGLRVPGIAIADPGCVAKTFPGFWDALEGLRG
jgi:3-phosphoshikimate 1-carboxyvinyltransferase